MLFFRNLLTAFKIRGFIPFLRIAGDWQTLLRFYFLHAAIDSGLLAALQQPVDRKGLIEKLGVKRPEILDALLELGLSLGEIKEKNGRFVLRGVRSRTIAGDESRMFSAFIQANVTYYNSIYREAAERLRGAPSGDYLPEIGPLVADFSKITEPFMRNYIQKLVRGNGSVRILDIGCGSGIFLKSAAEANANASGVGIDIDPAVVEMARRNMVEWKLQDRFAIVSGDIRKAPEEIAGRFDLITLYNIIYYFPEEERLRLFRMLHERLSTGGRLTVVNFFPGNGRDAGAANLNLATSSMIGCIPIPPRRQIEAELRKCSFQDVRIQNIMPGSAFTGVSARV